MFSVIELLLVSGRPEQFVRERLITDEMERLRLVSVLSLLAALTTLEELWLKGEILKRERKTTAMKAVIYVDSVGSLVTLVNLFNLKDVLVKILKNTPPPEGWVLLEFNGLFILVGLSFFYY